MTEPFALRHAIAPAAWLVGGLLLGWLVYRVVFRGLRRRASITTWGGDDIILAAIHDVVLYWFAIGGAYGALRSVPLRPSIDEPLEKTLLALTIASGTWVFARLAADLVKLFALRTGGDTAGRSSSIFVNLTRVAVYAIGTLVLLQGLGVSITPLLTALGVGGLAVALALQDTLSNLFAGVQLIAAKKVKPGDYIELDSGEEGYVTDINWRNTQLRQLPNNLVIVPNSKMASATVTNFNQPEREMSVLIQVGVGYDSDLEHVERVTVEVAREVLRDVPGGVPDFEPFIRYHTFGDSSINFTVILRTNEFEYKYVLQHEFVKRLHRRYEAEGIEIPFPIRTLHIPDAGRDATGTLDAARSRSQP